MRIKRHYKVRISTIAYQMSVIFMYRVLINEDINGELAKFF